MTTADTEINMHVLDAAYRPFPTFETWLAQTAVDTVRWERYNSSLKERPDLTPEVLTRARESAKRAAAVDTGAIEGLYEVDRGFTYTVAFETAAWETALAQKGEQVRPLFEAQLDAYDYVLTLATRGEPISEASVRALHEVVCRAQETYRVMTAVGPQEQPLPKGQYKALPNHVRTRKGANHSYAPVDVTPAEMARLVAELRSEPFLAAHPVIQAAYAHYALVVVHPFADGNGRVARALASAFTYRAISMPIVILSEQKNQYLDALANADDGDYQSFVNFILARSLDTIILVDESVRAALAPTAQQGVSTITALYVTKGGYDQDAVDKAGIDLLESVANEVEKALKRNLTAKLHANVSRATGQMSGTVSTHRHPLGQGRIVQVQVSSDAPAQANYLTHLSLLVPRDAGGDDDIQIREGNGKTVFVARMEEVIPSFSGVLQIRIAMFAESFAGRVLSELAKLAARALRGGQ